MSYLDILKKMNNYTNSTDAIVEYGKELENLHFTEDPSYRLAKIYCNDLSSKDLDIRIKNSSTNVNERKFILRPDTKIDIGSYIGFDDKFYLVEEYEDNSTSPYCNVTLCNQKIKLTEELSIPCVAAGESYGVKLTASNDFITDADTKIKVTVQSNSTTRNIPLNTRFILGFSEHGVYKISDITVYNEGMLTYICKKDNFREGEYIRFQI